MASDANEFASVIASDLRDLLIDHGRATQQIAYLEAYVLSLSERVLRLANGSNILIQPIYSTLVRKCIAESIREVYQWYGVSMWQEVQTLATFVLNSLDVSDRPTDVTYPDVVSSTVANRTLNTMLTSQFCHQHRVD